METDKLIILNNEKNQGKGSALRLAKNKISNKYIVIHDADLEYFPNDFIPMFEIISKNEKSFVAGSRFLKKNPYSYFRTFLANVIFSKLFSILYKMKVSDVSTCYKMMEAEFYKELEFKKNGFDIEIEIISTCVAKKLNYFEVPIDYSPRSYKDGKKISLVDGFKYIYSILDYRFKIN